MQRPFTISVVYISVFDVAWVLYRAYFFFLTPEHVIIMTPDTTVYEGLFRTCDQSTNLVLIDAVEKRNEGGRVTETRRDIVMLRGDQVAVLAPNDRTRARLRTSDPDLLPDRSAT
jgi:small nuclear ribonucleoprotein (snRNP)-like protein